MSKNRQKTCKTFGSEANFSQKIGFETFVFWAPKMYPKKDGSCNKKGKNDSLQQYKLKSSVSHKKIQHNLNGLVMSSFTKDDPNVKNSQINGINDKNKLNNV